jgi:hypothetical protein
MSINVDSMYQRLAITSQKLGYYGLRHRLITDEMLERMSGELGGACGRGTTSQVVRASGTPDLY